MKMARNSLVHSDRVSSLTLLLHHDVMLTFRIIHPRAVFAQSAAYHPVPPARPAPPANRAHPPQPHDDRTPMSLLRNAAAAQIDIDINRPKKYEVIDIDNLKRHGGYDGGYGGGNKEGVDNQDVWPKSAAMARMLVMRGMFLRMFSMRGMFLRMFSMRGMFLRMFSMRGMF